MRERCVTVLTPTYNRSKQLKGLFDSLQNQTSKEFSWIIVDDGSSDNTEEVVNDFIKEASFEIKYFKKANGGKHTALNYAYKFINTTLTFIVDSDDWLTDNAVEIIEKKYNQYKNNKDLCGYSFLRGKANGGILSSAKAPEDGLIESYCECRINRKIEGDMAEVWVTQCLKEFPFPEFKGEKFLGEDIVWIKMSEKYKLIYFNDIIYVSDYHEDGLTMNRRKHNIKSPIGSMERAIVFLDADIRLKYKIKPILQVVIYGKFAGVCKKDIFKRVKQKALLACLYPVACLMYKKWKKQYV